MEDSKFINRKITSKKHSLHLYLLIKKNIYTQKVDNLPDFLKTLFLLGVGPYFFAICCLQKLGLITGHLKDALYHTTYDKIAQSEFCAAMRYQF